MNCKDVQFQLQSFHDKDLPEAQCRLLQSHLAKCQRCAAVKRDLELLTKLARNGLSVKAPENFDRLLQQRLDTCRKQSFIRQWLSPPLAWSTAVALFAAVFVVSVLWLKFPEESQPAGNTAVPLHSGITPVILPSDPGTPGMHVYVPEEQRAMLVRVPSTVKITSQQLTQDFFLSEVSY